MSLIFALALLTADMQADAPVASAPPPATADATPVATQGQEDPDYLPKGAPSDDFGFVAWCDGVLSGHMDLAAHLADVLPLDDVQETIGHAYLSAYAKAMADSAEGKTAEGKKRAEAARLDGWSRWEAARDTPDRNLAVNTYLAYQLPGRCEHAAERLSHNPNLFARAPSEDEVAAMGTNNISGRADAVTTHASPPVPAVMPAPAPMTTPAAPTPQSAPAAVASPPAASPTGQISVQMTEETQPPTPTPAPPVVYAVPAPAPAAAPPTPARGRRDAEEAAPRPPVALVPARQEVAERPGLRRRPVNSNAQIWGVERIRCAVLRCAVLHSDHG